MRWCVDNGKKERSYYSKKFNPPHQSPPILKALVIIFLASGFFLGLDLFAGTRFFASEGPLSSAHAMMESKCYSCHTTQWTKSGLTMQERCVKCHAKVKLMKFHVSTHQRSKEKGKREIIEKTCVDCHKEHRGRDVRLSHIGDSVCRNCHKIFNIENDHLEFKPAKLEIQKQEDIGLKFGHLAHQKNEKNSEEINKKLEKGCLLCHQLDSATGFFGFKRVNFDNGCKDCHPHQELSIKKMFEGEELEQFAGSINAMMGKFGLQPDGNFLSRFEYSPGSEKRRRPEAFSYKPSHQDPYLMSLFHKKDVSDEEVVNVLSQGKKGTTLNCLKCHMIESGKKPERDILQIGQNISLSPVTSKPPEETIITKFSHKAHVDLGCEECHKNILKSEALSDINVNIDKKLCFSCHNNIIVKGECTMCHNFHKAMNQLVLSEMAASRREVIPDNKQEERKSD